MSRRPAADRGGRGRRRRRATAYFDPPSETLEPGRPAGAPARASAGRRRARLRRAAPSTGSCAARPASSRRTSARWTTSAACPSSTRHTLRDTYPDGLRICGLDNIIEVHSTSGTTGKPTPIWVTRRDMDAWAQRNARYDVDGRPAPGRPAAELLRLRAADERRPAVRRPARRHRRRARRHRPPGAAHRPHRRPRGHGDLHDAVLRPVPRRQGAGSAASTSPRDSQLRIGLFGAEPWPESGRERLAAAIGVDAFNEYGMGEFLGPGMAAECPVKDGMHVWSDHLLVECIDPETCEPVADGAPGELVWTSLTSDSTAMIRYRSHDISSLTWEPVRLRPHAPAHRPHHGAQRRRPLHRRPRRVPQPDRGSAGRVSTSSAATSAWSSRS